ncbi:N-methyl-L-tryptophan oxidase [Lactobacillaceae bacterium Melli_B4]
MPKVYDIAIIGTGSIGAAAGYYASKSGQHILELDVQTPPHDQGSHHGMTRIIRHAYGKGTKYLPLLLRSQQLWDELQRRTGEDIFHQTGVLNVGPRDAEFINNVAQSAREYQLPIKEYDYEQLHQLWPNFNFNANYQAIFEPQAGYLNSEQAIRTYIDLAKQNNVEQDFNAKVQSVTPNVDGTVTIKTERTACLAKQVIISIGTWVKELIPTLPIQPTRKVFSWFNIQDKRLNEQAGFPAFTVELDHGSTFYGFPGKDQTIKIGKHDGGQPINERYGRLPYGSYHDDEIEIDPLLNGYLSGTNGINHGAACTYDLSPDGDFIIDKVPNHPNIQIVAGLSGHGFKFASGLGELLANQALGKTINFDLTPFKASRFDK